MPKAKSGEGVLALDLGTSSVRAVVYDSHGAVLDATLADMPYKVHTTEAGEVSSNPDALVKLISQSIDGAMKAARKEKVAILAAGVSCYWHSLLGVDHAGRPTTELFTWADTRSASQTQRMREEFDERAYHTRTGCYFHASYWPAKLRWLRATRAAAVRRTAQWISLGEYLYQQLHDDSRVSHSIASGTGLLDVHRCTWDAEALRIAGISAEQLSPLGDWDQPAHSLRSSYFKRWPELHGLPWYLPLGDGALANVGAGCLTPRWVCATIGTSSALRILTYSNRLTVPWETFAYRVDRRRYVLGGALSEGGNVVRWFTDSLGFKPKKKFEREAAAIPPDSHGLTVLPFWAGERSPNWRGDARAVIAGLSLSTQPAQLLRAAIEAITYQMVTVAEAMRGVVARPQSVIATGGQLIHSPFWTQMLADALDLRVMTSPQPEASSRGAALLALHALGKLPRLWSSRPERGRVYQPRARMHALYERARRRQQQLYDLVYSPPNAAAESSSRKMDLQNPAAKH